TQANPRQGYAVILMRRSLTQTGSAGKFPEVADVATVRFDAELKPAAARRVNLGGPIGEVTALLSVPLALWTGAHRVDGPAATQEWRSEESLPVMPGPIEMAYRVAGRVQIASRTCLNIVKKAAQGLPFERKQGSNAFELQDYGGSTAVDP